MNFHFQEIFQALKSYLEEAGRTADRKIKEAQLKVAEAGEALRGARGKMQGWQGKLDDYKDWLQTKSDEIEESKKKLQNDCRKECGKGKRRQRRTASCWNVYASKSLMQLKSTIGLMI